MRKIVLFNSDLSGGAGKFIITLANALKKMQAEVHIIIYDEHIDYIVPKGIIFHLLKYNGRVTEDKKEIVKALQEEMGKIGKVDFLMSNSSPANDILSKLKLPNVYHCVHSAETKVHQGIFGPLKAKWRQRKYKKLYSGKNLITVSKALENYILTTVKAEPESIRTIYNPFDFEEIRRLANEVITGIPDEPYLIHVGRFDMVSKRQDILLKAYKKADISSKLVLMGDGPDKEKIINLVDDLGLGSKVILPGYSSNPYAWMKHAELFVFSSDFEGFGRVLAEALIVGTPVVSTDCPAGPREILTGSLSEFLVPTGNVEALAEKMKQALQHYPDIEEVDLSWLRDDVIAKQYMALIDIYSTKGETV